MTPIVIDTHVVNQLSQVHQPVDLCDGTGRVIGRFVPAFDRSKWAALAPEPTEAELDEIEKSDEPTYTTAEVMAHLENLP